MKKELIKIRASVLRHDLPLARTHSLQFVFIGARASSKVLQISCTWRGIALALLSDTQVGRLIQAATSGMPLQRGIHRKKSSSCSTMFLTLPTQCCPVGQEMQYPVIDHGLCIENASPQDRGIPRLVFLEWIFTFLSRGAWQNSIFYEN